ncbi:MAG TPA: hypothetical protein VI895_06990 [Bdellovibrionota bacterium]|nr:hypothetical protein [Bdellovibrionota bacterium]
MKARKKSSTIPWSTVRNRVLQDPETASEYLRLSVDDEEDFIAALRHVAEAQGIGKVAARAKLPRESVSRMLSRKGNPRLGSLMALLRGMKLSLRIEEGH